MYTIKDLSQGKCAVINDGTLEELRLVLEMAGLGDVNLCKGQNQLYGLHPTYADLWFAYSSATNLPTQSVKDFLTIPEKWCVKVTDENRGVLLDWMYFRPDVHEFVTCLKQLIRPGQIHDYQEIPFKLFELKILNKVDYTITAKEMKELYDSIDKSCEWSKQVFGWYGKNMLDGLDCNVTQYLLDQAKKDANSAQLNLINKIFKPKFKVGDWIICPDAENQKASQIIATDGLYYRTTETLHNSDLLGFSKKDNLRLAAPEEIERSQIKEGDLVWVSDTKKHWELAVATGEFNVLDRIVTNGTLSWKHYKKASQVVVDEYKRLQ